MILVAVGEDQAANVLGVLLQVGEIGRHDIDAEQFGIGEHHAGIDDENIVAVADRHAVHPEFAESAQGNDLEFFVHYRDRRKCRRACLNLEGSRDHEHEVSFREV